MPIYEYQCQQCDRRFETMQKMSDAPLTTCEVCGGPLKKLVSSPAVQFKGSGWYVTDYARKGGGSSGGSKSEGESKKGESQSGGEGSSAGGGESKSASQPAAESKGSDSKPKSD
jgi:putative FmdB family regulatory protein